MTEQERAAINLGLVASKLCEVIQEERTRREVVEATLVRVESAWLATDKNYCDLQKDHETLQKNFATLERQYEQETGKVKVK